MATATANSTTVRVDRVTHKRIKRLAAALGTSDGDALARSVRLMFQQVAAQQFDSVDLTDEEREWLEADAR